MWEVVEGVNADIACNIQRFSAYFARAELGIFNRARAAAGIRTAGARYDTVVFQVARHRRCAVSEAVFIRDSRLTLPVA